MLRFIAEHNILKPPTGGFSAVGGPLDFLYVDESGGGEAPDSSPSATPVFVMAGVIIPSDMLRTVTQSFVALKVKYYPNAHVGRKSLDLILGEVKGGRILKAYRDAGRNRRRHAMRFVGEFLKLLKSSGISVLGKAWVKPDGATLDMRNAYGMGMQDFARAFSDYLSLQKHEGVIIADSSTHGLNVRVAHSVHTQKYRTGADPYPGVTAAYMESRQGFVHDPGRYQFVRKTFGLQLKALGYRSRGKFGHRGFEVKDRRNARSHEALFGGL